MGVASLVLGILAIIIGVFSAGTFGWLGGIIGAKILYLLVSLNKIDFSKIPDPQYVNLWMSGGFVFYGG